jgi:hypothetical protein
MQATATFPLRPRRGRNGGGAISETIILYCSRDGSATVDVTCGPVRALELPASELFAVDISGEPVGLPKALPS